MEHSDWAACEYHLQKHYSNLRLPTVRWLDSKEVDALYHDLAATICDRAPADKLELYLRLRPHLGTLEKRLACDNALRLGDIVGEESVVSPSVVVILGAQWREAVEVAEADISPPILEALWHLDDMYVIDREAKWLLDIDHDGPMAIWRWR